MMISCDSCGTRKKIVGLGNLMIDCPKCRGIGWLEIPEARKVTLGDTMDIPKRKQKKKIDKIEPVLHCTTS